jgi:hypothetical protein
MYRTILGIITSGHRLHPLVSIEVQPISTAYRTRPAVLTRPMWTGLPFARQSAVRFAASSPSL